ncbi:MAG TPA: tetratricopeptide repeat protein [Cellvibrio sp.]|nr:tetratricopeptide repeat protein [Cellvibrio sp.]
MKKNVFKKVLFLGGLFFVVSNLVGCAGNVKPEAAPVVIEQSAPVAVPEVNVPVKPVEPVIPEAVPQTRAPIPAASSNATASLVSQARTQYQAKNYQGAIAIAERALRIDRRAPDVYLILAQSYMQLANTQAALQFVQQGIRFAQAGTDLAQTLIQVRDSLQK